MNGEGRLSPRAWGTAATVAACILASAPNAYANQPPGPMLILSEVLILPLMILLSMAGGAYVLLEQKTPKQRRLGSWARGLLAVFAILLSGAQEGLGLIVAMIFGAIALWRAGQMLVWGIRARGAAAPAPVEGERRPRPARLLVGGAALAAITLFLMGQALAFVGYWPTYSGGQRLQQLQRFTAHQMAYAEREESRTRIRQFRQMADEELRAYGFPALSGPMFRIEYGSDRRSFAAYLTPRDFPFFPYNYLTALPSYRADQSGQIRMVHVHWPDTPCPPDAPVVMTIGQEDLKTARERLEAMEAVQAAPPAPVK